MQLNKDNRFFAVLVSVTLHVVVLSIISNNQIRFNDKPDTLKPQAEIVYLEALPPPPEKNLAASAGQANARESSSSVAPVIQVAQDNSAAQPVTERQPASLAAPPAPTAQEWAFAAKYTLKNSKGYRYTWGHQVRSMMGTAIEGGDQGVVRFRVEIAPDGTLTKLETLWTTSPVAEQLARKAIENMPSSPPTPTGKPLIFEKTISFSPFVTDGPPTYKDDCLPDPPAFRNPFAWDGKSPQVMVASKPVEKLDPQALEECLKQLPQDSIEAESAQDRRLLDQWGSIKTGR
ncbi:MAG: energy transducer TonB [Rhodoferax sp.]|uniref:energy transducer TonB family protein n=1 Tax=Rhodoferax sp. TaxID=50421 RepID=UPI0027158EC5|nr:energy transducer TonB [Rhodoferax sp.]MDO8449082.1 energy transducer TonB [Rhodoferax sp.]